MTENDQGIYAALARAQSKFPPITKSRTATVTSERTGKSYTYNYADIADVLAAVRPVLADEGIAIVQRTDVLAAAGHVLVTTLYHADGSSLESQWRLRDREDPQSVGGDLTYFRRYQLSALIGIASEDDDDNARSKVEREPRQQRTQAGQPRNPEAETTPEQRQQLTQKIKDATEEMRREFGAWSRENSVTIGPRMTMQQLVDAHRFLLGKDALDDDNGEGAGAPPTDEPEFDDGYDPWMELADEEIIERVSGMARPLVEEWLTFFDSPTTGTEAQQRQRLTAAWCEARDDHIAAAEVGAVSDA